ASSVLRWIGSESRRKRIRLRNQARVSPNSDFRNLPFGPKPVLRIDSIEESHENRNLFVGVLSLGKIFDDRHQWLGWSKSDLAGTCLVPAPIRAAIPKRRPDAR